MVRAGGERNMRIRERTGSKEAPRCTHKPQTAPKTRRREQEGKGGEEGQEEKQEGQGEGGVTREGRRG